jgi:pantetheine-phosphate adenylyltransferase
MGATAVLPATFDPVTNGHVDIFHRASLLFDRLVIGVYAHPDGRIKRTLFTVEERVRLVEATVGELENVTVRPFSGLSVDLAREENAKFVVRGLRVADDFEFERQMAMMNRHLAPEVDTVLFVSQADHAFVSASLVIEVALMGGDVSRLVPHHVADALYAKARAAQAAEQTRDDPSGTARGAG